MSTQTLLLLSIGTSLYLGIFHLGVPGPQRSHRWLAGWSAASVAFSLARLAQMTTADPNVFVHAVRIASAAAPMLIWTLVRFVMEMADARGPLRLRIGFAALNFTLSALALSTEWIVTREMVIRPDVLGVPYPGSVGGPGMVLLGVYTGLAVASMWWLLGRPGPLRARERTTLRIGLTLYAAFGASTIVSSLGWIPVHGLSELGPLAVSVAASHLLAGRQREFESGLASLVDRQAVALRESAERYRELVDHAPIAVLGCDRDGNLLTANLRMFQMVGSPYATLQRTVNLLTSEPLRATGVAAAITRAFASGQITRGSGRYVSDYGIALELESTVAPQFDERGEIAGAVVLAENVTERNVVQARLRQAQKMEAVGQLASGIAHGINDPMDRVRTTLATLREECDALRKQLAPEPCGAALDERFAEMDQLLEESFEGVERTIAIVRDMRELSNGGSGARERVDVNAVIQGVLRIAATRRHAGSEIVERYGRVPAVDAHVGQLRQVLLNLLVNAFQAIGAKGRVELETFAEADRVCVRVRDDGPGIAPGHRDHLFEPFFTTKPAGEGTGLGLYLSYEIVQRHGGEIRVHSEPGAGACFEVRLPIAGGAPA